MYAELPPGYHSVSQHMAICSSLEREHTVLMEYGPRSSAVSGPCVWNDLPPTLHASPGTLRQLQSTLKTITALFNLRNVNGAFMAV